MRTERRMLPAEAALSVRDLTDGAGAPSGVARPAHTDRPHLRLIANVGWVPPRSAVPGLELSRNPDPTAVAARLPREAQYGMYVSGDAHRLGEILA